MLILSKQQEDEIEMVKALIVEGNIRFQRTIQDILMSKLPAMCLIEAGDGMDALKKVEAHRPDLVFIDVKLPGQNGFELTRKIKPRYPKIIIIILADYDFPEYREAARVSGADYFLVKGSIKTTEIVSLAESLFSGVGAGCKLPETLDVKE